MIHRYRTLALVLATVCLCVQHSWSQSTFHSKNVAVIGNDDFSHVDCGDVWGIRIAGTPDKHYALSTLGGGLSIVLVNGASPSYYSEVAYVNQSDTTTHDFADLETFVVNNTVYAALAIPANAELVVYIVNVDSAIALGQTAQDNFVPISSVQTATIPQIALGAQAHTITIADNRLYIATQTSYIDIWDVSNPYSPIHKGAYALPNPVPGTNMPGATVHEMYVDPDGPNGHRAYVAYTRGGLFIVDIDTANVLNSSIVKRQMYDSDKLSALSVFSADTAFDWRLCHSAWPTDNRDYIFTTDEISPTAKVFPLQGTEKAFLQATNLKVWKTSDIDSMATTSLKGNYFVLNAEEAGVINHSTYDTAKTPNSIHQLFIRDGYAYIAHYTQGFRVLDVGDPENLVEVAYYNVYDPLEIANYASSDVWSQGTFGVYPDAYRPKLCYAGSRTDGLSIFRHYHETIADTIYSIKRVNLDGSFTITGDTYIAQGTLVNLNNNSTFLFDAGKTLYVDGELWINTNTFGANSRIVCRSGGKIVICPEALVTDLQTMIIDSGGVLEVKTQSIVKMRRDGVIKVRGVMDAGLAEPDWARFDLFAAGQK
jgi:hypothetical protein